MNDEIDGLNEEISELNERIAELEEELKEVSESANYYEEQFETAERDAEELEGEVAELSDRLEELEKGDVDALYDEFRFRVGNLYEKALVDFKYIDVKGEQEAYLQGIEDTLDYLRGL